MYKQCTEEGSQLSASLTSSAVMIPCTGPCKEQNITVHRRRTSLRVLSKGLITYQRSSHCLSAVGSSRSCGFRHDHIAPKKEKRKQSRPNIPCTACFRTLGILLRNRSKRSAQQTDINMIVENQKELITWCSAHGLHRDTWNLAPRKTKIRHLNLVVLWCALIIGHVQKVLGFEVPAEQDGCEAEAV